MKMRILKIISVFLLGLVLPKLAISDDYEEPKKPGFLPKSVTHICNFEKPQNKICYSTLGDSYGTCKWHFFRGNMKKIYLTKDKYIEAQIHGDSYVPLFGGDAPKKIKAKYNPKNLPGEIEFVCVSSKKLTAKYRKLENKKAKREYLRSKKPQY